MAKYLSFDVGSKTIGIAKSDGLIASVLTTIRFPEDDFVTAVEMLRPIIEEQNPSIIVVGWPKNMNGTEGHRVQMVEDFIVHFDREFHHLEIKKTDERLTTRMARSIMIETNASRKKTKSEQRQRRRGFNFRNLFIVRKKSVGVL
jgi:putative Holliday junction resolvase